MWRKPGESNCPKLAAHGDYCRQVPLGRALPLWGGISEDGFAVVTWHLSAKKLNRAEWVALVRRGQLAASLREVNPGRRDGRWSVMCDNESFLHTAASRRALRGAHIDLWPVPPKSPDLNPVEMFWSWLRRKLRDLDLQDLRTDAWVVRTASWRR